MGIAHQLVRRLELKLSALAESFRISWWLDAVSQTNEVASLTCHALGLCLVALLLAGPAGMTSGFCSVREVPLSLLGVRPVVRDFIVDTVHRGILLAIGFVGALLASRVGPVGSHRFGLLDPLHRGLCELGRSLGGHLWRRGPTVAIGDWGQFTARPHRVGMMTNSLCIGGSQIDSGVDHV